VGMQRKKFVGAGTHINIPTYTIKWSVSVFRSGGLGSTCTHISPDLNTGIYHLMGVCRDVYVWVRVPHKNPYIPPSNGLFLCLSLVGWGVPAHMSHQT